MLLWSPEAVEFGDERHIFQARNGVATATVLAWQRPCPVATRIWWRKWNNKDKHNTENVSALNRSPLLTADPEDQSNTYYSPNHFPNHKDYMIRFSLSKSQPKPQITQAIW